MRDTTTLLKKDVRNW